MRKTTTRSGKDTTRRAQQVKRLTLEETLQEIRQRRVILTPGRSGRVVPFSPNTRLSRAIRCAIAQHNRELQRMMAQSDVAVCCSQDLHRSSFNYQHGRYFCEVCAQLLPEVS